MVRGTAQHVKVMDDSRENGLDLQSNQLIVKKGKLLILMDES